MPELGGYFSFAYSALASFRMGVGVGVFPEDDEILIGGAGFGRVALPGASVCQSQPSQRTPGQFPCAAR